MTPAWRNRFAAVGGTALAILVGWCVASGAYGWPVLIAIIAAGACCSALLGLSLDVVVLGLLLVGYILGNRGFAQLSLLPNFPLLPAEAGLALGLAYLVVTAAVSRQPLWRRDALNLAVLLWLCVGAVRIVPDVRRYGPMALRDFATVYYALFFFVAQAQARSLRARTFLYRCLLVATVAAIPLFELFRRFPDFFLERLTVAGIPVVFVKGDLVATFMAAGVVLTFDRYERTGRRGWVLASLAGLAMVLSSDNRSSLVALGVVTAWLVAAGRWRWVKTQAAAGVLAAVILLGALTFGVLDSSSDLLRPVMDRFASIVDFSGARDYTAEEQYKADNNQFRLVWWRTVAEETWDDGPLLGLGFGYDLAATFTRDYLPNPDEEFSARSPHSIVMTTFGRMGVVGALALLALVGVMAAKTYAARHDQAGLGFVLWLVVWSIFISACFGVVLEGPMGAVVFWTALGLANASSDPREPDPDHLEPSESEPDQRVRGSAVLPPFAKPTAGR